MRSSRGDDQFADSVAGDGEVPLQLGGAAGEVARQSARDHEAVCGERVGGEDIGRVCVLRGWTGLPGADLHGPVTGFALVDDGGVVAEQGDDRVDLALGVEQEVAAN